MFLIFCSKVLFPSTENIKKSFAYDNLNPWLGQGLLTSSGKTKKKNY